MKGLHGCFCLIFLCVVGSWGQSSQQSGPWNDANTWDCACIPDFNSGPITIAPFHVVTIPTGYTATGDQITVQGDGVLTIESGAELIVYDGAGNDLTIEEGDFLFTFNGTVNVNSGAVLENRGQIVSTDANLLITGTYQHNIDGGIVPTATWNSGSTTEFTGIITTKPSSGLGQTFYNVTWNSAQGGTISLLGELQEITNDLTISNTNGRGLLLTTTTNATINVGGDLLIQNNSFFALSQTSACSLNIAGNLTITSSSATALVFTATGSSIIDVGGSFSKSGTSRVYFSSGTGGTGTLRLGGNFSNAAGTLTAVASSSGNIVFDGTAVQSFSNSATMSNVINVTIDNGSTVDFGTSSAAGSGSFTCSGSVRLGSTNTAGALQGNIPLSPRTFNSGSSIYYNGLSAQAIGTDHPSAAGVNAVIDNASGVSLSSNAVIGGNLTLNTGSLSVGAYSLTLGGNVTANGNTINVGSSSSIVINGTGAFGTFPFPSGSQTLKDFTLNRASSGSVTFASDMTLTGAVILTDGNLIFSNQNLTLEGSFAATNGALYSNSVSTLTINGSGAFGALRFAIGGNSIHTLNFNRVTSGTGSINSSLTVLNALNLLNGDFTNTSGLALANGAVVTRQSTSQLSGSTIITGSGDYYSVVYSGGAMTTGSELPSTVDDNLLDLTINGGPVTLAKDIIVNGNVTLQSGTLDADLYDITLAGGSTLWARQTGSTFIPGSGTVYISGSTTVQGTSSRFGNLTVNSGGSLTANALMNVSGSILVDPGATFNHNNGVITFDGVETQIFGGGGKSFNTLRVNKSAGALQMSSQVNLNGALEVLSATNVQSNGSLVLISTSDAASGNARIGALPSGASVTGSVTAQRYMSSEGRIYRYISSPVSGASVADLQDDFPVTGTFSGSSTGCSGCTTNPSMFYYDETQTAVPDAGYIAFPASSNTETLAVGLGYTPFIRQNILPGPVTIDVSGTVNQGSISLPVTYTLSGDASTDGYNLVGNPYPSTIDWDTPAGWSKTNVSNTIAVRDNGSGGNYLYWNGTSGGLTNGLIAAGQGFWVQAMGAGPSLQINEQAKSSSTGAFFRSRPEKVNVLEMVVSNGKITDKAFLQVSKNSGEGLDIYDARKLDNVNFDLSILSKGGLNLAIHATNNIPDKNESIHLRIKDFGKGTYTFSLGKSGDFMNYDYFLLDRFTNEEIDLQDTPLYAFSVTAEEASFAPDRFELFLSGLPNGRDRRASSENQESSIRVFPNPSPGAVQVKADRPVKTVMLLNPLGHMLESISNIDNSNEQFEALFDLTERPNGIYMVHIIDLEGRISVHKVLKE